jgi:DNA replication protein DnaC
MSNYINLQNNLDTLQLTKIKEILPNELDKIAKDKISFTDALNDLTDSEIKFRDERAKKVNVMVSNFPYYKTLKDFDFTYQTTINKAQIEDLCSLRFIEEKENIIFIGSPGVGKTHLATSIGIEAASQRISTYFINFATLMEKFKSAAKENRVEQVIKHYMKYTILIIDEIGYLPIDRDCAFAFFQLVAARYEKKPLILTTNQNFSRWGELFGDNVIANAIIDRLVHHSVIIKITGQSYRIKGKDIYEEDSDLKTTF